MFFRKKSILFFALSCLSLFFLSFFINSIDVSAVSYFSGNYTVRRNLTGYDWNMYQAFGNVSYAQNNSPIPTTTPSSEGLIVPATSSTYAIYVNGIGIYDLTFSGYDTSQKFQSAEANSYLYLPITTNLQGDFIGNGGNTPPLRCVYHKNSGGTDEVFGNWDYWESSTPHAYFVELDCPVVSNDLYDAYTSIDMILGNDQIIQNTPPSNYIYYYLNGGGVWFSSGTYQISSTDNEELNAIENQTIIIQNGLNDINNSINEHYDREYEAVDNISNQSPSDISDSENETSSNLINAVAGFTSAVSRISIADSCTFTLPFPSYAGGDIPVNLCQNKEKAPEIVLTFGNITLIAVALGFWIKCIVTLYRLIRSFIDGIDDGHYIDIEVLD